MDATVKAARMLAVELLYNRLGYIEITIDDDPRLPAGKKIIVRADLVDTYPEPIITGTVGDEQTYVGT